MAEWSTVHALWAIGHAEKAARTGRVVVMPEWAGSLGRYQSRASGAAPNAAQIADRMRRRALDWYQDAADTLNYVDTLPNVDASRIAYFAESYGTSVFGTTLLALQPRFKAAIFLGSGIILGQIHPMLDAVHFAPRVTQPMLMINGRYDPAFPHEHSQRPLFELLGTADAHKRMVMYDDGHFRLPETLVSREIAIWLDRYLGKVAG